jgi:CO dehydrogenase/acetyl-CoA synthase gamma subunit (corrinoid Fe-S protein)
MTHTYTVLDVPHSVYTALRTLLEAAGYAHAFLEDRIGEVIDLHGLALRSRGGSEAHEVVVSSLLSHRTSQGRVELALNGEVTQMDLDKAREVVGMLQGAIEAAVSDELLYRFLTGRVDMAPGEAAAALLDFREMRQGSRGIVRPH